MDEQGAIIGGTILFTIVIIVFSIAATVIPIVLIFRWLSKMKGASDDILMRGIPAQGRIVQIGQTGLTINDAPQLNIMMEVTPPMQQGYRGGTTGPFMANVQALVPIYAMARLQPGSMVNVRFDPMNPMRVAIDFRSMGFM